MAAKTIVPAIPSLWVSVINYFSLCVLTGVSMAFVLGGSVVRIGVAEKGGALGGDDDRDHRVLCGKYPVRQN